VRLNIISRLVFLILSIFEPLGGISAQQADSIQFAFEKKIVEPKYSISFFSSDQNIPFETVRSKAIDSLFRSDLSKNTENSHQYHWLRLDFENSLEELLKKDKWFLEMGFSSHFPRVFLAGGQKIYKYNIDIFSDREYKFNSRSIPQFNFSPLDLIDGRYLYIKHIIPDDYIRFVSIAEVAVRPTEYYQGDTNLLKSNFKARYAAIAFFGFGIVMLIFSTTVYIYQKANEFLYYGLFTLCSLLYLSTNKLGFDEVIFRGNYHIYYLFLVGYQFFIYIFYFLFASNFLEFKRYYPFLSKLINVSIKILVGLFLLYLLFQTINYRYEIYLPFANWVVGIHRIILIIVGQTAIIVLLFRPVNRLAYFIVSGSLIFTFGSLLYLFLDKSSYQIYGTTAEMLIFTLGLAYKYKKSGEQLILMEKEAAELKMSALKAQMNPHFIFNSLNSIQYFVLKNDTDNALNYLGKFSQMLRRVLDHSMDGNVTLDQEIELLSTYLELEKLRFEQGFSYQIVVNDNIDPFIEQMPLLLIQPYVENAIKHGLLPSVDPIKKLVISFELEGDRILCKIEDNGVGIDISDDIPSSNLWNRRKRKSRGMTIARERLSALYDNYSIDSVSIENKSLELHGSTGTIVKIRVPRI